LGEEGEGNAEKEEALHGFVLIWNGAASGASVYPEAILVFAVIQFWALDYLT
jgi:predicted RNA-binding protein with TRAM domain